MNYKLKYVLIIVIIIISSSSNYNKYFSQIQLLKNGDFEKYEHIPKAWGQSHYLSNWKALNKGKWSNCNYFFYTEDYEFLPKNTQGGEELPFSNYGFVGVGIPINKKAPFGYQLLATQIQSNLLKDSTYVVIAHVSLADKARNTTNYLPISLCNSENILDAKPGNCKIVKLSANQQFLNKKKGWMEVRSEFVATGNERYLVIGDILDSIRIDKQLQVKKQSNKFSLFYFATKNITYYFLDNIQLYQKYPLVTKIELKTSVNPPKATSKITLSDLYFMNNSFSLQNSKNDILDSICNTLKKHQNYKIQCIGYTDNIGDINYNKKLSENRAYTVFEYFKTHGIDETKITYKGLGEENPIASNILEETRKKNRRVEILIEQ